MKKDALLLLLPTALAPEDEPHPMVRSLLPDIDFFICERIRTTRRWLRSVDPTYDIDGRLFFEYDKHTHRFPISQIRKVWESGKTGALTSEAGTPAVADPGYEVVAQAHRDGVIVKPLPGNNAIILGLMASGLNGNQFTYHGYFPIQNHDLKKKLTSLNHAIREGYTQIFIETPYRNQRTIQMLIQILPPHYRLSVSSGLLSPAMTTRTLTLQEWKNTDTRYLHKVPAVFYIGK